jgi:hypothetical protein
MEPSSSLAGIMMEMLSTMLDRHVWVFLLGEDGDYQAHN